MKTIYVIGSYKQSLHTHTDFCDVICGIIGYKSVRVDMADGSVNTEQILTTHKIVARVAF